MFRISIGLIALALAGCSAHMPISLSDDLKPRTSIHKVQTQSKSVPTIIVSHGSAGIDQHTLHVASKMKNWGFNTVVIDHYREKGIAAGLHNVATVVKGASGPERALDIIAAARWIQKQPWHSGKIVLIGYSQGGAGVNALASKDKMFRIFEKLINDDDYLMFGGAIGVYPGCGYLLDGSPPAAYSPFPVQLHIASDDDLARPEWCSTEATNYQLIHYEGATHGFDFTAHNPRFTHRYNPRVASLSFQRMEEFTKRVLNSQ